MPEWAVPDAIIAFTRLTVSSAIELPFSSSTPAVPPAMINRLAPKRSGQVARERVGIDVQQFAFEQSRRCSRSPGT